MSVPQVPLRLTVLSLTSLYSVVSILSTIDSDIQHQSIKDCYRLGKFSLQGTRPRPILIKLIRISNVSKILSKKGLLSRPHSIKPDMSREQRLFNERKMGLDTIWCCSQKHKNP